MNKALKVLAYPIRRLIGVGYSRCECCDFPWNMVEPHTIEINEECGAFAVCEDCWKDKSYEELEDAYDKLWFSWVLGDKHNPPLTATEIGFTYAEYLRAVNNALEEEKK